jgi:parvulin-like peptidyl-prolyl isomerase
MFGAMRLEGNRLTQPKSRRGETTMFARSRQALIGSILFMCAGVLFAQTTPGQPTQAPPSRDAVAARVNGQSIHEIAVYRALARVSSMKRAEARAEVINYLVDNTIIDQYLIQLKIPVDPKEVEEHIKKLKDQAAQEKQDFKTMLARLYITEDELRHELVSTLRWDKFVLQQGSDAVLRDMFTKNVDMFNGKQMQARHILIQTKDGKNPEAAQLTAANIKRTIEAEVGQTLAKLPATTDAITRERERSKALESSFVTAAKKYSTCPSAKEGGDLRYFRRAGDMVEPFARAAFALKPFEMSEPVLTEFGVHLILAVDVKPGRDIKFEQAKPFVQEVYAERLREAVLAAYKSKSKIEIVPRK